MEIINVTKYMKNNVGTFCKTDFNFFILYIEFEHNNIVLMYIYLLNSVMDYDWQQSVLCNIHDFIFIIYYYIVHSFFLNFSDGSRTV